MAPIVVAVDYSEPSRKALDAAVALAEDLGQPLVMVHALALPLAGSGRSLDPISQVKAEIGADEARELATTWAAQARKRVEVETVAREGKAVEVVLDEARKRKASLIVVGSHGRSGLGRAVLGSVAEAIVRTSKVPVVVVPS